MSVGGWVGGKERKTPLSQDCIPLQAILMEFRRSNTGFLGFTINEVGVVQRVDGLAKTSGLQSSSRLLQVQYSRLYLFVCLSVCLLSVCLPACCLSVCLSGCLSVCLSV